MPKLSEVINLRTLAAQAAGTATGDGVTFKGPWKDALVQLNVSVAATEVDDTLDVYVDTSPDGGTSWYNVGHFTQVLGNGGAKKFMMSLGPAVPGVAAVLLSTSDAAAGATRQIGIGDRLRVRGVVVDAGGTAASFTWGATALMKP